MSPDILIDLRFSNFLEDSIFSNNEDIEKLNGLLKLVQKKGFICFLFNPMVFSEKK